MTNFFYCSNREYSTSPIQRSGSRKSSHVGSILSRTCGATCRAPILIQAIRRSQRNMLDEQWWTHPQYVGMPVMAHCTPACTAGCCQSLPQGMTSIYNVAPQYGSHGTCLMPMLPHATIPHFGLVCGPPVPVVLRTIVNTVPMQSFVPHGGHSRLSLQGVFPPWQHAPAWQPSYAVSGRGHLTNGFAAAAHANLQWTPTSHAGLHYAHKYFVLEWL